MKLSDDQEFWELLHMFEQAVPKMQEISLEHVLYALDWVNIHILLSFYTDI